MLAPALILASSLAVGLLVRPAAGALAFVVLAIAWWLWCLAQNPGAAEDVHRAGFDD